MIFIEKFIKLYVIIFILISIPCFAKLQQRFNFSPNEDKHIIQLVQKYGTDNWKKIANEMPNRNTRQCRKRYYDYLAPDINFNRYTYEERESLIHYVQTYGKKWAFIVKFFNGRTATSIKNEFSRIVKENELDFYSIKSSDNRQFPNKEENSTDCISQTQDHSAIKPEQENILPTLPSENSQKNNSEEDLFSIQDGWFIDWP